MSTMTTATMTPRDAIALAPLALELRGRGVRLLGFLRGDPVDAEPQRGVRLRDLIAIPETFPEQIVCALALAFISPMIFVSVLICFEAGGLWP